MARRKPWTHTIDIKGGGGMARDHPATPCRLTKRHVITEHLTFNRSTGRAVGAEGFLVSSVDMDSLTPLPTGDPE